jgi:Cu+-exporting ATPase
MPMHDAPHFFETSAVLISFVLLGRLLQARAVRRTSSAMEKLMDLAAKTALVIIPENNSTNSFDPTVDKYEEKEVPAESVQKHDIVKIIRGSSIPADGKVLSGELTVNESMITGEPMPVYKHIGYDLIGGTIVAEGTAFMIVRNVGKDTALSKICRMVEEATAGRAPIQEYADKVSSIFVPFVVIIAVITFVIWMSLAEAGVVPEEWYVDNMAASSTTTFSLLFAISVLVISCPCALGLATPTAVMVGTGVGASHGILIKGGEQLQNASEIQAIIFDKVRICFLSSTISFTSVMY